MNSCQIKKALSSSAAFFLTAVLMNSGVSAQTLAFPGAMGWAAFTEGGRGGKIIRVTNLYPKGPGSFLEAIMTSGPRIVVFEVGGVIDLSSVHDTEMIELSESFITIAGQTAPSPGITLIKKGIRVIAHDVVIQHIRVRPGEAGHAKTSGWEPDGISLNKAYNVIVDHCSCTWAVDENLSASGLRFEGADLAVWRQNTSHRVTFSNCIIAAGLSNSTHSSGEHSKGTLLHDNTSEIAILRNLYAHNMERNPLFKGGAEGVVVNNYIYNPGKRAADFGLKSEEWGIHPWATAKIALVGNVMKHGHDSPTSLAFFTTNGTPCMAYFRDNIATTVAGGTAPLISRTFTQETAAPVWPGEIKVLPAASVKDSVFANVGARPWDRDAIDLRIINDARNGTGSIINGENEMGGYPVMITTHQTFNPDDWDLATMTRKEISGTAGGFSKSNSLLSSRPCFATVYDLAGRKIGLISISFADDWRPGEIKKVFISHSIKKDRLLLMSISQ